MKKAIARFFSAFCCLAVLTSFLYLPRASAAAQQELSLRIEGPDSTVYSKAVEFSAGENLYQILADALGTAKIPYNFPNGQYGHSMSMIDNITAGKYGGWDGWQYDVNGQAPDFGIDGEKPVDGDSVVVFYGATDTLYPTISVNPKYPTANGTATVNISSSYTDYSNYPNVTTKTVNVQGASVVFNGKPYTTDNNGNATLSIPATAGTYSFTVSKERTGSYPLLVRTAAVPLTVYKVPSGQDSSMININDPSHPYSSIDVPGGTATTLKMDTTVSGGSAVGTVTSALTTKVRNGYRVFELDFSQDTKISGPTGWDGTVKLPQLLNADAVNLPGKNVRLAFSVGAGVELTLDKPAKLVLPLQSGKKPGYIDAAGVFHAIGTVLQNNDVADGFTGDAYYDDGTNLDVYTTHFCTFVSYVDAGFIAVNDSAVNSDITAAAGWLAGNGASDWNAVLSLALAGHSAPQAFLQTAAQTLAQNNGSFRNPTQLAGLIIGLKAAGANPADFNGYNLVQKLYSISPLDKSGLNGFVYGLLALDCGAYSVPSGAANTRDGIISGILSYQNADGSFSLDKGSAGDPDMTAVAVTALAPYLSRSDVQSALSSAVGRLSAMQTASGGYIPYNSTDTASESASQVAIALSSIGVDPLTDKRFVKNGKSLLENILSYRQPDGGFSHLADGSGSDTLSTEQALLALEAYKRFETNGSRVYDLTSINPTITSVSASTSDSIPNPDTSDAAGGAVLVAGISLAALTMLRKKH